MCLQELLLEHFTGVLKVFQCYADICDILLFDSLRNCIGTPYQFLLVMYCLYVEFIYVVSVFNLKVCCTAEVRKQRSLKSRSSVVKH